MHDGAVAAGAGRSSPAPACCRLRRAVLVALVLAGCGGRECRRVLPLGPAGEDDGELPLVSPEEHARPRRRRPCRHGGQAGAPGRGPARRGQDQGVRGRLTVSGPIVPGEGLPDQPGATTCTWTVTMKNATADVPVSLGRLPLGRPPRLGVPHGPRPRRAPPAAVLHPGQTLTFQLRAYELVGEGMMQWAPGPQARRRPTGTTRSRTTDPPSRRQRFRSAAPTNTWPSSYETARAFYFLRCSRRAVRLIFLRNFSLIVLGLSGLDIVGCEPAGLECGNG